MQVDSVKEESFPFLPSPIQRRVNPEDIFFLDGNQLREIPWRSITTPTLTTTPTSSIGNSFKCNIAGCNLQFSSCLEYDDHYRSLHINVCSTCKKSLPSAWLLDLHITELHDPYFSIISKRMDMYSCLVESCLMKFRDNSSRHTHLVDVHRYPKSFNFHGLPRRVIHSTISKKSKTKNFKNNLDISSMVIDEIDQKMKKMTIPGHLSFGRQSRRQSRMK